MLNVFYDPCLSLIVMLIFESREERIYMSTWMYILPVR
jgi:hypothetical protein